MIAKTYRWPVYSMVCMLSAMTSGAYAQSVSPQAEADAKTGDSEGIGDIVVTARRAKEELQSVPLAVTAFTGEALEQRQINTAEDLSHVVPSLSLNSPFGGDTITNVRLRGLPGVATYFGEVPTAMGGSFLFVDLQNVQVLKGPQGVAFGMNTTGGAILLEPRRPADEFGGQVRAIIGDHGRREGQAVLNLPIATDKVLTRLVVNRRRDSGYTGNLGNGERMSDTDFWYVRFGVTLKPTDDFESYTVFDYYDSDNNGPGVILTAVNRNGLAARFFPGIIPALDRQNTLGIRASIGTDPGREVYRHDRQIRVVNNTRLDVTDGFAVKNILSYTRAQTAQTFDLEGSPFPLLTSVVARGDWGVDTETVTEEFQLSGNSPGTGLNWVAGYFLSKSWRGGDTQTLTASLGGLGDRTDYGFEGDNRNRSDGLYAQAIFDLGALSPELEGLRFTGGYRYTWDKRQQVVSSRDAAGRCVTIAADANCRLELNGKFHASGYTAAIDWQASRNALIYIRSSRGYTSGGFNPNASTPENRRFGPEHLTDVELGLKADWNLGGDIRLRTNAAAFYGWYDGIQRSVNVVFTDALGRPQVGSFTQNAAKAHVQGVELESVLAFPFGLQATAAYSFVRGRYDRFISIDPVTLQPVDLSGLAFTNFPEHQWSLSGRYQLPVPEEIGKLSLSAFYSGQSKTYFGLVPSDVGAREDAYSNVDLRLDWTDILRRPFDAALFITNLTNNVHRQGSFTVYTSLGTVGDVFAPPRMFGIELRYRFGS